MHHEKLWNGIKPSHIYKHTDCGMFWEKDCKLCGKLQNLHYLENEVNKYVIFN